MNTKTYICDFAAFDNQVKKILEPMFSMFPPVIFNEEFSSDERYEIYLTSKNMIYLYTKIKYERYGRIRTDKKIKEYIRILCMSMLGIVVKWCADIYDYTTKEFCLFTGIPVKEALSMERDILSTFDYDIFRYMPVRNREDYISGSPVVSNSPTKNESVLYPMKEGYDYCSKNPWVCLCHICIRTLDNDIDYAFDRIVSEELSPESMMRDIKEANKVAQQNRYCPKEQTKFLYKLCCFRKGIPNFWNILLPQPYHKAKYIRDLIGTLQFVTYRPYHIILKLLSNS